MRVSRPVVRVLWHQTNHLSERTTGAARGGNLLQPQRTDCSVVLAKMRRWRTPTQIHPVQLPASVRHASAVLRGAFKASRKLIGTSFD